MVSQEVGAYPRREEYREVACAEERLSINALDAPLAELIPGKGVNCTGLQAFRRGKVACVDKMGVPEILSEKDPVDVRKRNI